MSYFNTRRRMNALVVVLLVINVFSITALWLAKQGSKPGPPGPKEGEMFLREALQLSDAQVEQLKVLREDHFREMHALRRANEKNRRNMFDEVKAVKPDSVLLVKYAAQIGSAQAAIEELTVSHFLAIKAMLSPEQVFEFNQTLERLLPPPPPPPGPGRRPPPRR